MQTNIGPEYVQGTAEWLSLRKTKITATDASVILGVNKWKTPMQLYIEKTTDYEQETPTERMQRGIDLEPVARYAFSLETGIDVYPDVVIMDFHMASLDGISPCRRHVLEIKCPGPADHAIALSGKVPDHYYAQLQHQMYVCDVPQMYYYSFDGREGVVVVVKRDDEYIETMLEKEQEFYNCMINKTPPRIFEERNDEAWQNLATKWISVTSQMKELEKQEAQLREQIIWLAGQSSAKGSGISLSMIERKGNVDYSQIPEIKGLDLEPYRKPAIKSWRLTAD